MCSYQSADGRFKRRRLCGGNGSSSSFAGAMSFACDIGGTFTDLVTDVGSGPLRFYKRPTTPADPVEGLFDVISAAAADLDLSVRELLGRGDLFVHGTTRATNAI